MTDPLFDPPDLRELFPNLTIEHCHADKCSTVFCVDSRYLGVILCDGFDGKTCAEFTMNKWVQHFRDLIGIRTKESKRRITTLMSKAMCKVVKDWDDMTLGSRIPAQYEAALAYTSKIFDKELNKEYYKKGYNSGSTVAVVLLDFTENKVYHLGLGDIKGTWSYYNARKGPQTKDDWDTHLAKEQLTVNPETKVGVHVEHNSTIDADLLEGRLFVSHAVGGNTKTLLYKIQRKPICKMSFKVLPIQLQCLLGNGCFWRDLNKKKQSPTFSGNLRCSKDAVALRFTYTHTQKPSGTADSTKKNEHTDLSTNDPPESNGDKPDVKTDKSTDSGLESNVQKSDIVRTTSATPEVVSNPLGSFNVFPPQLLPSQLPPVPWQPYPPNPYYGLPYGLVYAPYAPHCPNCTGAQPKPVEEPKKTLKQVRFNI